MATESGSVRGDREAVLRVRLAAGEDVECVVDTGFSGHLVLPRSVVSKLGLAVIGREVFEMVAGHSLTADLVQADLAWLGVMRTVEAVVSEGEDALLGTSLLDGTKLTIDYIAYTVTVSDETN